MNKPIAWWQAKTGKEEIRLVTEVLEGSFLNEGDVTREFEKELAALLGCKYVVTVPNGTIAIFLALKAHGIGIGDEVIVPDLTWIATANAVELTGAKVVLCDVDPNTLTINVASAEKAITTKTKAIVPVHVSGRGSAMEEILDLAKNNSLIVIEDAAEALASKYKGKYLGTWGNAGAFSLSVFKIITTGQGGFITTDSNEIYQKLRELKNQGLPAPKISINSSEQGTSIVPSFLKELRGKIPVRQIIRNSPFSFMNKYLSGGPTGGDDWFSSIGYNFKMTNILSAIGLGQLKQLPHRIERIKKTLELYKKHLNPNTINLFPFNTEEGELPLWIDAWSEKRNELCEYLLSKDIETRNLWHPIHKQKIYLRDDEFFPGSTKIAPLSFWLPSSFQMEDTDVLRVCSEINNYFHSIKQ